MTVATRLKHFLEFWKVNYMVLNHSPTADLFKAAGLVCIPVEQIITGTVVLIENQIQPQFKPKAILCIHRLIDTLDIQLVAKFYNITLDQIKISSIDKMNHYFDDCDPKVVLPFGEPYSLPSLIDRAVKLLPYLYFSGGGKTSLVRLCRDDFIYLTTQSRFSQITMSASVESDFIAECLASCVSVSEEKKEQVRVPPDYVTKIVEMANTGVEVGTFEEHLRQHVVFHSLFYPSMTSIRDKFSVVSHVVSKPAQHALFSMLRTGPLGLDELWKNSLCAAELARKLSWITKIPYFSFSSELAYYCGLFHHFGYLVYGHLYGPEFNLLGRQWHLNQYKLPIGTFEKRILTLGQDKRWVTGGHTKMGASLLSSWGLDSLIVITAEHHHDQNFEGDGAEYVWLIYLCDQLLAHFGHGDGVLPIDENLVNRLGLSIENILEITSKILHSIYLNTQDKTALPRPIRAQ